MYWTTADCTGYNFVKHYKTDLGESVGDNYGNWAEAMGDIQKLVAETVGNAGFVVGRDLPWLKYTELQMVIDLDWNNNGKDDFSEYKEKFSLKSGR